MMMMMTTGKSHWWKTGRVSSPKMLTAPAKYVQDMQVNKIYLRPIKSFDKYFILLRKSEFLESLKTCWEYWMAKLGP